MALNDDRPDVKQVDPENKGDFEAFAKAINGFGATLSEAITKTVEQLRKAVTPRFVLVVLKHNYQMTPKWRIIRRYQLRRKIAEVQQLVDLNATVEPTKKADDSAKA